MYETQTKHEQFHKLAYKLVPCKNVHVLYILLQLFIWYIFTCIWSVDSTLHTGTDLLWGAIKSPSMCVICNIKNNIIHENVRHVCIKV